MKPILYFPEKYIRPKRRCHICSKEIIGSHLRRHIKLKHRFAFAHGIDNISENEEFKRFLKIGILQQNKEEALKPNPSYVSLKENI